MRILLVENHAVFAGIVTARFLSQHQVELVATVADARFRLREGHFDAVLVDFDLDDLTGDQLVRELRASAFPGRIIGISSHQEGNAALLAAGAQACCPEGQFEEILTVLGQPGDRR